MANLFLDSNEVLPIAAGQEVFGQRGGTEGVRIQSGVTGVDVNANVERIELAQNAGDVAFAATGDGLEIRAGGATVATVASLNQASEVRFTDGDVMVRQVSATEFEITGDDGSTTSVAQGDSQPVGVPLGDDSADVDVPQSELTITSKSGTIEAADAINVELGGQTATVDFSGNQDASGVASTIASQVTSLSNVATASASNQTITFQAVAESSVAIGAVTETDANDSFTIETSIGGTESGSSDDSSGGGSDDGGSDDGGSSDGGSGGDSGDAVLQSSLMITSKSGTIEAEDSIDITLGGQTANVNFSGNQDASGIASTIASQVTSLSNVAGASADNQTVTFRAAEGGDVSIDGVSETDANDSFNIETDFTTASSSALMPADEPVSALMPASTLGTDGMDMA